VLLASRRSITVYLTLAIALATVVGLALYGRRFVDLSRAALQFGA
jgi:hypothetical protein